MAMCCGEQVQERESMCACVLVVWKIVYIPLCVAFLFYAILFCIRVYLHNSQVVLLTLLEFVVAVVYFHVKVFTLRKYETTKGS